MTSLEALRLLRAVRKDYDIVVSAMGAARDWMALGTHPRDWVFVPSSMGQATSLGLGLALARPDLRVIVLGGDGGLIMNLGSLITITAQAPANLFHPDSRQRRLRGDRGPADTRGGGGTGGAPPVDLAALARASGFETVFRFGTLDEWTRGIDEALAARGPVFAVLTIAPLPGAPGPRSPGPAPERAKAFMAALLERTAPQTEQ